MRTTQESREWKRSPEAIFGGVGWTGTSKASQNHALCESLLAVDVDILPVNYSDISASIQVRETPSNKQLVIVRTS